MFAALRISFTCVLFQPVGHHRKAAARLLLHVSQCTKSCMTTTSLVYTDFHCTSMSECLNLQEAAGRLDRD